MRTAFVMGVSVVLLAASWMCGGPPAPQEKKAMPDKEQLASRIAPLDPDAAMLMRTVPTKIEELPTPFFERGAIYRVTHMTEHRPRVYTVGSADSTFTVLLPANPDGFMELAGKAGLRLATSDHRLAYITTFLEATRSFGKRFQVLRAAADLKERPNLTKEKTEQFRRIQEKYGPVIRPPQLLENDPWRAAAYALKGQDLVKLTLKLSPDGKIETEESVLEKDVPVPYAL